MLNMNPLHHLPKTLCIISSLLFLSLLGGCGTTNPHYDPNKPHHRPNGFVNSNAELEIGRVPWYEILHRRWRGDFKPKSPPEGGYTAFGDRWVVPLTAAQLQSQAPFPRLIWLGHASLLLQVDGRNILIDPNLSDFAGPTAWLSAKRVVPAPLTVDALPPIHLVLISHNHYDHLDENTLKGLWHRGDRPQFIVPLGLKRWFDAKGISGVKEIDWWERIDLPGLAIHLTPAQHWSKRTLFDANATLWGGFFLDFAVDRKNWKFLYTGDTGYSDDFKEIHRRLGAVDLLAVPIGAYEPRDFMRRQHNNPDEAIQIMLDTQARYALGVHWGSFELSNESLDQPPKDIQNALSARNIPASRFWLPKQGEILTPPVDPPIRTE